MRRICLAAMMVLLAGCGVQPSGATDAGEPPTGVAPGMTLYFIDADGELRPQPRDTDRLGTIAEALALLLVGPAGSDLRTEIATVTNTRVGVTVDDDVIELIVPLAFDEVTESGIDQIVCTALAAHVQSGGSTDATVWIRFTVPAPGSDAERTCPLLE